MDSDSSLDLSCASGIQPFYAVAMSISPLWFASLPAGSVFASFCAPSLVFAAPPAGDRESREHLAHCLKIVQRYVVVSAVVTAAVYGITITKFANPSSLKPASQPLDQLLYALKLELVPLSFYVFSIMRVALGRGGDPKAVLGQRSGVSASVEIASRVLQNTTEQLILGVSSRLIMSTVIRQEHTALLPASVALWLAGRILFTIGYTPSNPMGREFGFDLTLMSSLAALGWSVYAIFLQK